MKFKNRNDMNISIYTPILYPWVADLERAFSDKVGSVRVYTTGIFGNYPAWRALEEKMHVVPHRVILGDRLPSIRAYFRVFREPADLFVISGTETTGSLVLTLMARLKGIPAILIVEENMDVRSFYSLPLRTIGALKKILIGAVHRRADILLPETGASRKYLLEMGCFCGDSTIAPHGIDTQAFRPGRPDRRFAMSIGLTADDIDKNLKVLYAGGFNRHKGIDTIVELLEKGLVGNDTVIIIPVFGSGIGKYRRTLKKFNNVRLVAQFSPGDMKKIYRIVDVVLVPSIISGDTERSPNIVIEALASGRTVIASDIGGIPTIVGSAGILVPQRDARAVAVNLKELGNDRTLLKHYGKKARRHALRNLSSDRYADTILAEYYKYMKKISDR